ncbi:MAG TPA: ABC transporter ATP-binding protein [Acidimicrobiales bacterium]|nr:ABC transporter ATP-binding protein [Acidimicrobiales bacterium]
MHRFALWRVRSYVRPHVGRMVFMIVASLVATAAAAAVSLVTKAVIDGPLARGDRPGLLPLALLALGLGTFEGVLAFLRRYTLAKVAVGIETEMRNDLYEHLQALDVGFHDRWQTGQLLSRAVGDISVIRRFIGYGLTFLFINACTFVFVIFLLARMHFWLAMLTAVGFLPVIWLSKQFNKSYGSVSRLVQDQTGDLTTMVEEGAQGVRVIKAYGRRREMHQRFLRGAGTVRASSIEMARLRARFFGMLGQFPKLSQAAVLLGGAVAVADGSLTIGGLVAFLSLMVMLIWPVESLGEIIAMGEEASTAAERIFEVLDTAPAIAEIADPVPLPPGASSVRFENVSFAYPGSAANVLGGVDLEVRPGETLALVGATGSGKTTLLNLIPRLLDVTGGRITIDGLDVRDLSLAELRARVAVAFEEPNLFSASVRENVLLAGDHVGQSDLDEALEVAQAKFVHDLPWGLDTRVGEQGLSLSGGQRQRVALARAVVGRPGVLVLDDPLSALDVRTEERVHAELHRVLRDVTAIIAVHRPSTVALADRVAFLHEGRIAAVGTHRELLATNDEYAAVIGEVHEDVLDETVLADVAGEEVA